MIINTILKHGQCISPSVLSCVARSENHLAIYTSPTNKKFSRENVYDNWSQAYSYSHRGRDPFIAMDSNVFFLSDTIKVMINELDSYGKDVVISKVIEHNSDTQHGFYIAKSGIMPEIFNEYKQDGNCFFCRWLRKNPEKWIYSKMTVTKTSRLELSKRSV